MAKNTAIEWKHIVMAIGTAPNHPQGIYTAKEVEEHLGTYTSNGWTMFNTFYLGAGSLPGTYNMMYLLSKIQDF